MTLLTMHPTLLIGPYDWNSDRLPPGEFLERIENFWQKIADPNIFHAIVYGDSRNHAELAYLSNFTPKLGPALLWLPRHREPRLLVSGAPNMLSAARRLTWIEIVEPLRDTGKTLLQWINEGTKADHRNSSRQVAVIAEEFMRSGFRRPLMDTLAGQVSLFDTTSLLRSLMRRKSPAELAIIRAACEILETAIKAFKNAHRSGASVTAAVLASEHATIHAGAQDVRTLMSLDGGRTLRPFDELLHHVIDPLQLYIALRHSGYWVEGFVCSSQSPNPALIKAVDALRALSRDTSAGTTGATLFAIAANAIAPYRSHIMTQEKIGNSIGLALEAEPFLQVNSEQTLEDGDVYSLRVGATDGCDHHAIVSALIAVKQNGCDVLWSAA